MSTNTVEWIPGPWEVDGDLDIASTGKRAVNVATCGTSIQRFYKTAAANAHLIAAAPDLYRKLEALLECHGGPESAYKALEKARGEL